MYGVMLRRGRADAELSPAGSSMCKREFSIEVASAMCSHFCGDTSGVKGELVQDIAHDISASSMDLHFVKTSRYCLVHTNSEKKKENVSSGLN